jgi:hypothetical protein
VTYKYVATGESAYPFVAPTGGKEPLLAQLDDFDMGSDHEVYQEASWRIPAIYLHDWPDRYIHTTMDTPDRIDATKLLRAGFIGAASGYFLASMSNKDTAQVRFATNQGFARDQVQVPSDRRGLDLLTQYRANEVGLSRDLYLNPRLQTSHCLNFPSMFSAASGDGALRFKRNPKVPGPISVFGYDYLRDKIGEEKYSKLRLLEHNGLRGAGGDYAYEALNWSYWNLRAIDIANFLSATYGPVPV